MMSELFENELRNALDLNGLLEVFVGLLHERRLSKHESQGPKVEPEVIPPWVCWVRDEVLRQHRQ